MLDLAFLKLSSICYVTEELDRVREAMYNSLPKQYRKIKMTAQKMTSQFNDKITFYSLELKGKDAGIGLAYISSLLSDDDKNTLNMNLPDRIDLAGHAVHFRLDKFRAFEKTIQLGNGSDVIKIEIKYFCYTKDQNTMENVITTLRQYGMGS